MIGLKSSNIAQITGCIKKTIRRIIAGCVLKMKKQLIINKQKIGGPGITVEIDESKFGRRKFERGRLVSGVWVVGSVECTPRKRIFIKSVARRDRQTLEAIIKENVMEGSTICIDCWRGYSGHQ